MSSARCARDSCALRRLDAEGWESLWQMVGKLL
ncbi:hypothetical protein A2U01_0102761, partial [Trifolium medium]|nr:hypothetical protein [Trifolium medium]